MYRTRSNKKPITWGRRNGEYDRSILSSKFDQRLNQQTKENENYNRVSEYFPQVRLFV